MSKQQAPFVIPVWPGVAPGSERWTQQEVAYKDGGGKAMVRNVVAPTLTVFLPDPAKATGAAAVVCPGGGFRFHSWDSEGIEVAQWLRERGVAAFVLKYRLIDTGATSAEFDKSVQELFRIIAKPGPGGALPPDPARERILPLAVADGRQALAVVRRRAAEWGVDPKRVGILGFSAGAMVTMGAVLAHDPASRPAFAAPIYGGGTGGAPVPGDAPPLFVLVADDDALTASGCLALAGAWRAAGKSVELHVYAQGGHGFGMRKQGLPVDRWIERFGDWLGAQGLLKPA